MNKLGQTTQTPDGKFHIGTTNSMLAAAIKSELTEHFSCPAVSGYALTEFEAQLIAGGIIQRLKN